VVETLLEAAGEGAFLNYNTAKDTFMSYE